MRSIFLLSLVVVIVFVTLSYQHVNGDDAVDSASGKDEVVLGFSEDQEKTIEAGKESFEFQAEVNRLMDIIINSLCKCISIYIYLIDRYT